MRTITKEMRALLAGKKYHHIYSEYLDEFGVVAYFFNEVIKNMEAVSADVIEGKRMSSELNLAADIQKKVLPTGMPTIPGLDIWGSTRAAAEVGGDSFGFITYHDNTFCYVGDVTGHGAPAALVMMMVNTLINTLCEVYQSGYDVVVHTNRLLKPRIQQTMFMTMVMLRWNAKEQKIYVTGAGHEHVLVFHRDKKECEIKQTGGIALGMIPDNSKIVKEEVLAVSSGDLVVLYSDGIVEARNTAGEQFGIKRLQESVQRHGSELSSAADVFTAVSADFASFVEGQTQMDDITLIIIRRTV